MIADKYLVFVCELKQDLITEIKSLIELEVEKVLKKQKEEFDETVMRLQQ